MTEEQINYRNNLLTFVEDLKKAVIYKVDYYLDTDPTFKKELVPFEFKYCHSVVLHTSVGNYDINSRAMTTEGVNTFWVTNNSPIDKPTQSEGLDMPVRNVEVRYGYLEYGYKIVIHLPSKVLTLCAAEVYDTWTERLDFKFNDEMIFAFDQESEVKAFERLANYVGSVK